MLWDPRFRKDDNKEQGLQNVGEDESTLESFNGSATIDKDILSCYIG